jgi:superfamily I DNA/RNA helicase/RecB family exonuclease
MSELGAPAADTVAGALTEAQRRIVEWGEGPLVVVAGAGTGKTRVIVERVRWLLDGGLGPLEPEQVLVLTYNVKAARELGDRIEAAIGPAQRARLPVSNFHSFCHRILTESGAEAGLPARPDVLDGVGQTLLLRDIRPDLGLLYHGTAWWLGEIVNFINRAKDELVTPDDFGRFVATEREVFETRYGDYEAAVERLQAQGNLAPVRAIRSGYARLRRDERAAAATLEPTWVEKEADKQARRTVAGDGSTPNRNQFPADEHPRIDALARTYVTDGAALEVLRLTELGVVYRAYQAELAARGALDFGEQISLVTQLFKRKPNVLRRYQRQFRHILVDETQDANIAQIELIELLGRAPDRPDDVIVVGDDDQSIYRFRGASFAAFVELDRRFSGPPTHDPTAPAPGPPARLRLEENFRSVGNVLTVANRLIERNELRYAPDKALRPTRPAGDAVEVVVASDEEDEARRIVERIMALSGWSPGRGAEDGSTEPARDWSAYAVLYRKHRHREAIVTRLREAGIPYSVVGGLSLFETPEIRDLEQSLRAITDPFDDVAFSRMLSAAPWRLDAIELLRVSRMAHYDRRHVAEVVREIVDTGEVEVDRVHERAETVEVAGEAGVDANGGDLPIEPTQMAFVLPDEPMVAEPGPSEPPTKRIDVAPETRAKLRRLLRTIDALSPRTWREGPFTLLEELVTSTGVVFDLLALDSLEAKRMVANIGSFMRFAQDWQAEHPRGTLAGFVDYLDAYRDAGGELPTSVEASVDRVGVQLMTLYQAKGLEFETVFVPQLLGGEWPVREFGAGYFPRELLREAVPEGDIHTEEERRLLYVALTRARDRLMVTTLAGPGTDKDASIFIGELTDGAGPELSFTDEVASGFGVVGRAAADDGVVAPVRAVVPQTARERRLEVRQRAVELIDLLEGIDPTDPEAPAARAAVSARLAGVADAATDAADASRAHGVDPLTLRVLAAEGEAGANLLDVAPLPDHFSYSQVNVYEACPLRYAFSHVYRIPSSRTAGALTFGSTAHRAFEAFTRERRERAARGEPAPTRADLERLFEAEWRPGGFEERVAEEGYRRRVATLLDNFWEGELVSLGEALMEETDFALVIPVPGGPPATFHGQIDRIDKLPSGGIEVIDYKTGGMASQKSVAESLQLSIYALACRDALSLGTPERVTLYFAESATRMSTTRTDEELDEARDALAAWVSRVRSGDFAATPSAASCRWCDFASLCPSRAT